MARPGPERTGDAVAARRPNAEDGARGTGRFARLKGSIPVSAGLVYPRGPSAARNLRAEVVRTTSIAPIGGTAAVCASSAIVGPEAASAKFEKSKKANSQLDDTSGWILVRRRFPMIGRNPDHPMRQRRGTNGDGRTRIGHRRCAANPQQRSGYAMTPVLQRARSEKSRARFPFREQQLLQLPSSV